MTVRVLVAGGNGRLGRHVLSLLGPYGVAGVRGHVTVGNYTALAIDDPANLNVEQLAGFDAIINCAGRVTGSTDELMRANVLYPQALAENADVAGVARFIQVSSFSVFGRPEWINDDSPLLPDSDYGRSKLASERALAGMQCKQLRILSVRLPVLFSAADPGALGRMITFMLRLRMLPVTAVGANKRSMITYAAAAEVLVRLATANEMPVGSIVAADPTPLELAMIAKTVEDRTGRRIRTIPVSAKVANLIRPFSPTIVDRLFKSSVVDPTTNWLKDETGYPLLAELLSYLDQLRAHNTK